MVSKRILSLWALLLLSGSLLAGSVAAPSEQPAAFTRMVQPLGLVNPVVPAPIDLPALLQEDQQRQGGAYRFAIGRTVQITPQMDGLWEDLDANTLLWRIPIVSPGAFSLSLGFTRYHMPAGGKLFIYSDDHSRVLGPFTNKDNREHGQLWTPIIPSDSIVVELAIPLVEVPQLKLELTCINHGYRDFGPSLQYQALGDAAPCNRSNNVACPENDSWRDQIRSVALCHVTIGGSTWGGTGTLVNNTAQNNRPYFLTAFHLFDQETTPRDLEISDSEKQAIETNMIVYWNFQAATCSDTSGSMSQFQRGGTFKAGYWYPDFALVELKETPPPEFNVYYAGWDRNSAAPSSGVAIHHPQGDLKKINYEYDPLSIWFNTIVSDVDHGTCFIVNKWEVGMTEPISSGCPLFNPDRRIVGQLIGGSGTCDSPGPSAFGPFYRSWSEGGNPETRLGDWLDPLNTGVMFLDGKNPGDGKNPAGVLALPSDLVKVAGVQYASLDGLAPGSQEAEDRQRQAVQQLGLPLEVKTRQTGIAFRLVPAGSFTMGSPSYESGRGSDETQHPVTLTQAFYCGKFEVTQGEWQRVMGSNPSYFEKDGPQNPVEQVSWEDCQVFMKKLCEAEGVLAGTYRLLTEAEWEYACRAGTTTRYCFGDSDSALGQYAWFGRGDFGQTGIVGSWKANAFGLYDMHGNVWEWCQDWYGPYLTGPQTDPPGPASGGFRVCRGGSFINASVSCRSAFRNMVDPGSTHRGNGLGLRLARTVASHP